MGLGYNYVCSTATEHNKEFTNLYAIYKYLFIIKINYLLSWKQIHIVNCTRYTHYTRI